MMLKKGILCVLYFLHTVNKRQTGHFPADNFIFWPWILISGIICTFKMLIKVSLWTWNLGFWESAPKQAQKHLLGNSSGMLHKWDPETLLSCSDHREDTSAWGKHLGRCSELQLQCCWPLVSHSWVMKHHPGVCDQVWAEVLLPKTIFCKMEKQPWGTLLFLLPPRWCSQGDGDICLLPWAVPQRWTRL